MGKDQRHLQLILTDQRGHSPLKAIAWRWGEYAPLPACLDLAYKLQVHEYRGEKTLQLEIVGCRLPLAQGPY